MRVMRLDSTVAYTVTGIFVISTLIVGAELLYSAGISVDTGDQGLLDLSEVLRDRYGAWAGTVFLVGFWSAAMSSLVGVWNGVSMMFADFMPFRAITLLWILQHRPHAEAVAQRLGRQRAHGRSAPPSSSGSPPPSGRARSSGPSAAERGGSGPGYRSDREIRPWVLLRWRHNPWWEFSQRRVVVE